MTITAFPNFDWADDPAWLSRQRRPTGQRYDALIGWLAAIETAAPGVAKLVSYRDFRRTYTKLTRAARKRLGERGRAFLNGRQQDTEFAAWLYGASLSTAAERKAEHAALNRSLREGRAEARTAAAFAQVAAGASWDQARRLAAEATGAAEAAPATPAANQNEKRSDAARKSGKRASEQLPPKQLPTIWSSGRRGPIYLGGSVGGLSWGTSGE